MEAMRIKNVLESNDIAAVLVGDSVLPNFSFDVRVARDQAARARQLLTDIEAAGPAVRGGSRARVGIRRLIASPLIASGKRLPDIAGPCAAC